MQFPALTEAKNKVDELSSLFLRLACFRILCFLFLKT